MLKKVVCPRFLRFLSVPVSPVPPEKREKRGLSRFSRPSFPYFLTFAPRLLAAFGSDRERWPDAASLQQYLGVAPVTERSGNKHWVHWRWACPKFLRQSVVEWAGMSVRYSVRAAAHYQQQRERGKGHHAAIRALAFKWLRILHRCWKDRKPYDEAVYLKALQKSGSPLLAAIAGATAAAK